METVDEKEIEVRGEEKCRGGEKSSRSRLGASLCELIGHRRDA